ncbi:mechanosensitive ion channel family protein [Chryseolinea lacunae]|uniref:Mechanosensitive ion channel family protein n=1 Tax=Chryseolinea lacunae TaxID=2801331 RepID=A0ABS1KW36_9BACT|nr:mechanosensitive ion channel family protein [Chryseolinea lacunae]MBL0742521.1 mechanosensitive ion channel family protein [Chryseolinea lacunae]
MEDFLSQKYFNNTVEDYLIAASVILVGMAALAIFKKIILIRLKKWSEKTETNFDNYVVTGLEKFGLPIFNFIILYAGTKYLTLSPRADRILEIAVAVAVTYFALRLISTTVLLMLQSRVRSQEQGEEKVKQLGGVMLLLNIIIWALGILFLFDNLGYDVTTIIAGLGIGGIAIALAAQNILGDLFNYFVIFFDRPFEIGDYIVIDDKKGNVEHIGIKTTRLKSLTGEQLVFSNSDLTNSRIHNFKRMERRRIVFTLNVVYDTPLALLEEIPSIIKKIIEAQPETTLDRVHFLTYGDYSLRYEVVFFVENADYNRYADIHQKINLNIYRAFQEKNIQFAYPSQTIFLAKDIPATTA